MLAEPPAPPALCAAGGGRCPALGQVLRVTLEAEPFLCDCMAVRLKAEVQQQSKHQKIWGSQSQNVEETLCLRACF